MSDEAKIHDESYSSPTQQAVHQLLSNFSGDGSKLAFQQEDGSVPTEVHLVIQVDGDGDIYFTDNLNPANWLDNMEPENDYGRVRFWKVNPTATRMEIREALQALVPSIEKFLAGSTVYRDADGKRKARLSEEAIAIEESIGIIGRRA